MKILDYLERPGTVLDFIERAWDWQEDMDIEFIEILLAMPEEVLSEYRIQTLLYRGMKVDLNEIKDRDWCSWSTQFKIATDIADTSTYKHEIGGCARDLYKVVYNKYDWGICLNAIYHELIGWMNSNQDYIESELDWQDPMEEMIKLFRIEEYEVISNFKTRELSICLQELITINL